MPRFVLFALAALLAILGYHFYMSGSVERRLGEQGQKLEDVGARTQRTEDRLSEESKRVEATRAEVGVQTQRIDAVEKRLGEAEGRIQEAEGEVRAARESAGKDRNRLQKLEENLEGLRRDHQRTLGELSDLRKDARNRDDDFERRLRALERQAKIVSPSP